MWEEEEEVGLLQEQRESNLQESHLHSTSLQDEAEEMAQPQQSTERTHFTVNIWTGN